MMVEPKKDDSGLLFHNPENLQAPNFYEILGFPILKEGLPSGFVLQDEASYLKKLWEQNPEFRSFKFPNIEKEGGEAREESKGFVCAGSHGMVFRVRDSHGVEVALKLARKKIFEKKIESEDQVVFPSPFKENEINALKMLSHPNVVAAHGLISEEERVVGISTTYVKNPKPLYLYLKEKLGEVKKSREPNPERSLDGFCDFLTARYLEISDVLKHMHELQIYHFDIKPANILISSEEGRESKAMLIDLGCCVHRKAIKESEKKKFRVQYTCFYAHKDLANLEGDLSGIPGGGPQLHPWIDASDGANIEKYDLFALGRTIQETLGILEREFEERCFSSNKFRYLHLIACLLLDGKNSPSKEKIRQNGTLRFVNDVAWDYPLEFFETHKIKSAEELHERLARGNS